MSETVLWQSDQSSLTLLPGPHGCVYMISHNTQATLD